MCGDWTWTDMYGRVKKASLHSCGWEEKLENGIEAKDNN